MALLTSSWITDLITLVALLIGIAYYYLTATFNYWNKRNVSNIKPIPIFGNWFPVFSFRQSPGQFLQDLYKSSSDKVVGLYIFRRPFLLIRDPELVKSVCVRDFQAFNERCHADCTKTDPIGCNNLFNMKNPHWRAMRIKLTPIFSSGQLKTMFPLFEHVSQNLNEHFHEKEGQIMEMKSVFARFSTDVIASVAFGVETNSFKNSLSEFYQAALSITKFTYRRSFEFMSFFFAPLFVSMLNFKFFGDIATDLFDRVFREALRHRKATGYQRNDLVNLLMKVEKTEINLAKDDMINEYGIDLRSIKFDDKTLTAQSAIIFTAGYESGSSGMSLFLQYMARHPEYQTKIRNEINQALVENNGELPYDCYDKMKFFNMCINEILRMYPPLPFIDRECTKDFKIPDTNITIEKGTPVLISLYGLQMDPTYFPNPEVFDPERWNDENIQNVIPYTYLPFGEGPRNCIGKRFALVQTRVGLAYILKDFEIVDSNKVEEKMMLDPRGLLTTPLTPIRLIAKRIEKK